MNTMIKKFESFDTISRDKKIDIILLNLAGDTKSDYDDLKNMSDEDLDKFYNNIISKEGYIKESDGSTVANVGSGTAVGGASGSFTSAAGVSVSGGDSGSAFSTNSNVSGMGAIISAQPSQTPGDLKGSTIGSGDIGSNIDVYTKEKANKRQKKAKNNKKRKANMFDELYKTKYMEENKNGKIVQKFTNYSERLEHINFIMKTDKLIENKVFDYLNDEQIEKWYNKLKSGL